MLFGNSSLFGKELTVIVIAGPSSDTYSNETPYPLKVAYDPNLQSALLDDQRDELIVKIEKEIGELGD